MSDDNNSDVESREVLKLTSEIVAAHVSNNSVAMSELPNLIEQVFKTLANVGKDAEGQGGRPTPAVIMGGQRVSSWNRGRFSFRKQVGTVMNSRFKNQGQTADNERRCR